MQIRKDANMLISWFEYRSILIYIVNIVSGFEALDTILIL